MKSFRFVGKHATPMPEALDFRCIYHELEQSGQVDETGYNAILELCVADWKRLGATWHALGFINITLWHDDFSSLRLHIWPGGHKHKMEQSWKIHDHVYDFTSHILWGAIADTKVSIIPKSDGQFAIYEVEYLAKGSMLRRQEISVESQEKTPKIHRKGDAYTVSAGEFHYSQNAKNDASVSLMLTRNKSLELLPKVLVEGDQRHEIFRPNIISTKENDDTLLKILNPIANSFG